MQDIIKCLGPDRNKRAKDHATYTILISPVKGNECAIRVPCHSQKGLACYKTQRIRRVARQTLCLIFASLIQDPYLWMESGAWRRHLLSFTSCHQTAATVGGGEYDFLLSPLPLISSGSCGYSLLLLLLLSHL